MYILLFVICCLALFFGYCYIKRMLKRLQLLLRLKRIKGADIKILNPMFLLSKNSGKKFDFSVETEDKIVYVKLFSILRKSSSIVFNGANEYKYKTHYLRSARYGINDYHTRKMDYLKVPDAEFNHKHVSKVILFCPVCRYAVSKLVNGSVVQMFPGDYIDDFVFSNGTYLCSSLSSTKR